MTKISALDQPKEMFAAKTWSPFPWKYLENSNFQNPWKYLENSNFQNLSHNSILAERT